MQRALNHIVVCGRGGLVDTNQLRSLSRGLLAPYQVLRPGVVHEMPNVAEHVLAQAHAVLQEQLRRVIAAIGAKPRSAAQFVICHDFRPLNDLADTATSDLLYCVVTTEEVNILHWQELDPVAKTALQRPFDQDQPNGTYTVLTAGDTIWGLLHISCVVGERSLLVQQFTSYLGNKPRLHLVQCSVFSLGWGRVMCWL